MSSSYYRQAASLADEADAIVKEFSKNDTGENIRRLYQKLKDYLVRKYEEGNLGNFAFFLLNFWLYKVTFELVTFIGSV